MKKAIALVALTIIAIVAIQLLFVNEPEIRKVRSDIGYFTMKNDGKVPKAKQRPNDWFHVQRAYPGSEISVERRLEAAEGARELHSAAKTRGADDVVWEQAGPTNIPGRIADIAVHPSGLLPVFAASAAGGIFKLSQYGYPWEPIFDDWGPQSMGAIAIHPDDLDIMYAGTGEANGAADNYEGTGIYKTTDGGLTWSHTGLAESYHIGRIVVDPMRPETLYVAVAGKHFGGTNPERGVYRSTNGGADWDQFLYVTDSTGCIDLALNPSTGTIIAAMWEKVRYVDRKDFGGITSGLHRSTDFGQTWEYLGGGLPQPDIDLGRIGVTLDPQSNTAYAIYSNGDGEFQGIYKSTNLGTTWVRTNDAAASDLFGSWNGGWYFGQIRVAPGNPDIVYALGVYQYKSSDGGNSWGSADLGIHVDHHAMWIYPDDPNYVYNGCDGGVNLTPDGADQWTLLQNLPNTQFYAIAIDPNNPDRLYGGTQDNGTLRTPSGLVGGWERILGGDGFYCIIDYKNSDVIYAEYQYGQLRKSTDDGDNFSYALAGVDYDNERHNWNTPVVMDPNDHNVLYYGSQYLYRTTDGAGSWAKISGDLTDGLDNHYNTITTIDVARSDAQVIYVGTGDGNLWGTTNTGQTWTSLSDGLPDRWVTRVTVDPMDAAVAYATFSGYRWNEFYPHIFRTTDYGQSWTGIHSNLPDMPINDVVIDFHDNSVLYIATDYGVYFSDDLGGTWQVLGTGIPTSTPVHDLAFDVKSRLLVAGTHGRSIYKTTLACPDDTDSDGDGIMDLCDNCPGDYNPGQEDFDNDLLGDICDPCTDTDGDGFGNPGYPNPGCLTDNCPDVFNPDQADGDGDGIGDLCDFGPVHWDTISTLCTDLVLSNFGNYGNEGEGNVNLDYVGSGDCDGSANVYIYDGSPVIGYVRDNDTIVSYSVFGDQRMQLVDTGEPTVPTENTGEYEVFRTGTFVTRDSTVGVELIWYAPQQSDSCEFVIRELKVYSFDGQTHSDLTIGDAIDWDVPSDGGYADNSGGYDEQRKMVYQQGVELDYQGCQFNDERFAAISFIGVLESGVPFINTSIQVHGAYVEDNETYIWPQQGFDPPELYTMMQDPGYRSISYDIDAHSVMTYYNDYDIDVDDTLSIFTLLTTVKTGTLSSLHSSVDKGKEWFSTHLILEYTEVMCGDANGNQSVDIDDVVYLLNYIFQGGPEPQPHWTSGDVDCSDGVDIDDVVYLIMYIFQGGPAPCELC